MIIGYDGYLPNDPDFVEFNGQDPLKIDIKHGYFDLITQFGQKHEHFLEYAQKNLPDKVYAEPNKKRVLELWRHYSKKYGN